MVRDLRRIISIQALRAFAYGFGSILIADVLASGGLSDVQVGLVFSSMLAGMALVSILVGRYAERVGRRRLYLVLLLLMAAAGAAFSLTLWVPVLILAALTGTLSTDPNESGPITSLEQAMIGEAPPETRARVFGGYNAVAYLAGAAGALAAGGPEALRGTFPSLPANQSFLLVFPAVAAVAAARSRGLSAEVEAQSTQTTTGTILEGGPRPPLDRSKGVVRRLSALFALDSFAGGFIVQTFLVFWLERRFGASADVMGAVFFAAGLLQAGSSVIAGRLAGRIGLLNTMVFTHLPSNVLLALVPFAPSFSSAIALLLCRFALSQMDVPARQAYVVAMVDSHERAAASAYTNTSRYVSRPFGPAAAGSVMAAWTAGPFVLAGGLKIIYDLALYGMFRKVPLPEITGLVSQERFPDNQ